MLVLSRMRDEEIWTDGPVKITIVDVRGDKVRLGLTAAEGTTIHRKEIWLAIADEGKLPHDPLAMPETV